MVWYNFTSFLDDTTILDGIETFIAKEITWALGLTNTTRWVVIRCDHSHIDVKSYFIALFAVLTSLFPLLPWKLW